MVLPAPTPTRRPIRQQRFKSLPLLISQVMTINTPMNYRTIRVKIHGTRARFSVRSLDLHTHVGIGHTRDGNRQPADLRGRLAGGQREPLTGDLNGRLVTPYADQPGIHAEDIDAALDPSVERDRALVEPAVR